MTKHLFRLVWNRKRQNGLVIVEIFFSFIVLFAVTAAALWALDGMRRPLGYETPRVLNVSIRTRQTGDPSRTPRSGPCSITRSKDAGPAGGGGGGGRHVPPVFEQHVGVRQLPKRPEVFVPGELRLGRAGDVLGLK